MYRLYKIKTTAENVKCLTESKYREIFNEHFNISFHIPSKDKCDTCELYTNKQATGEQSEAVVAKQERHLKRKEEARLSRDADKACPTVLTAVFDLQQVMNCSKLIVGSA